MAAGENADGELPHGKRCTCVKDGVRCSAGRASPVSRNDRCEGCSMGLHKGHRTTLSVRRWYQVPGYRNRRSIPTAWHCYTVDVADERRDYVERTSLCGRTERFKWRGSGHFDSQPSLEAIGDIYTRARWKKVCTTCRTRAAEGAQGG